MSRSASCCSRCRQRRGRTGRRIPFCCQGSFAGRTCSRTPAPALLCHNTSSQSAPGFLSRRSTMGPDSKSSLRPHFFFSGDLSYAGPQRPGTAIRFQISRFAARLVGCGFTYWLAFRFRVFSAALRFRIPSACRTRQRTALLSSELPLRGSPSQTALIQSPTHGS